jgi:glutathionylspermidine synthase
MQRVAIQPRPGWRTFAEQVGFHFHSIAGEPYWDESAYYRFSLAQIENDIEAPTEELHQMAMDLVAELLRTGRDLERLGIPEPWQDAVAASWERGDPHLYGRMDLAYDGQRPAKLLELNYDTPTSLYETGFFQWVWLEDLRLTGELPAAADQFNSLQDKLAQALQILPLPRPFHFSCMANSSEDRGTVAYLLDIAQQSGVAGVFVAIEELGALEGQLVDATDQPVRGLFKLYPWEFLIHEPYAPLIHSSQTLWLEPLWKLLLSNKGILPLLWERYPGHPNLLPAYLDADPHSLPATGWVRKPLFSREGANVTLVDAHGQVVQSPGPYTDSPCILQAWQPLAQFSGRHAVLGSWVVGDQAAGLGIREDHGPITRDSACFLPHVILD